jgi:ketosteroid isomerase-like protein
MTEYAKIEAVIESLYSARRNNYIDTLMAGFDANCTFRIAGSERLGPITQRIRGREQLREVMLDLMKMWDFTEMKTDSVHIVGEVAVAHRSGRIRFVPTGKTVETELIDKISFKDGKVIDFVEFADTLLVAETIGAVAI